MMLEFDSAVFCWRDSVDLLVVGPEERPVRKHLYLISISIVFSIGRSSGLMSGGAGESHDIAWHSIAYHYMA